MAARITKSNLLAEINEVNEELKNSGSVFEYRYQSRNNYHAVDLYKNGKYHSLLDCAEPPKVLINKLLDEYEFYLNKTN